MADETFEALISASNSNMQLLYHYLLVSMILAPFTPWDYVEDVLASERMRIDPSERH
jgi:hypothetical protein